MHTATMEPTSPATTALRHRAAELRRFAVDIERSEVFSLDVPALADTRRTALCRRMLDTNLRQLLAAAEHLREVAWRLDARAAVLDLGHRGGTPGGGPGGRPVGVA